MVASAKRLNSLGLVRRKPKRVIKPKTSTPRRRPNQKPRRKIHLATIKRRRSAQIQGKLQAQKGESLHLMGAMLHWTEGSKDDNAVAFANTDTMMLRVFLKFLRTYFPEHVHRIGIRVNVHLDMGLTIEDVQSYWLSVLGLPLAAWLTPFINTQSTRQVRRLKYGVCTILLHKTEVLHHIYGAIQEYIGEQKREWLFINHKHLR